MGGGGVRPMVTPMPICAEAGGVNAAQAAKKEAAASVLSVPVRRSCKVDLRSCCCQFRCRRQRSGDGELFFEQGSNQGEDVLGDDLVAFGGGVGLVALHHALGAVAVIEEEGQEG